ncbi:uncharacterized protein ARMOST_12507 [Armillaria ostoyae]|uniref:Uncharacterized protein n=1 Tax=Armillaria ostoyae TaxID=47428 RepID=A0A284RK46_ARMOS|nr:uncharacterized protein ARMOST_12507 [Armillaria ostoyae]
MSHTALELPFLPCSLQRQEKLISPSSNLEPKLVLYLNGLIYDLSPSISKKHPACKECPPVAGTSVVPCTLCFLLLNSLSCGAFPGKDIDT